MLKAIVSDHNMASLDLQRDIFESAGVDFIEARPSCVTEDEVIDRCAEASALLVQRAPITRRVLKSLPKLKGVVRYGIGVDDIHTDTVPYDSFELRQGLEDASRDGCALHKQGAGFSTTIDNFVFRHTRWPGFYEIDARRLEDIPLQIQGRHVVITHNRFQHFSYLPTDCNLRSQLHRPWQGGQAMYEQHWRYPDRIREKPIPGIHHGGQTHRRCRPLQACGTQVRRMRPTQP